MAFAPAAVAFLAKRAAAIISAEAQEGARSTSKAHMGFTLQRLIDALKPRATALQGYNGNSLRSLAQSAIDAANVAQRMRDQPGYAPRTSELPSIPRVEGNEPRYRYEVVVSINMGGQRIDSWRTTVVSDAPLDAQQVASEVSSRVSYGVTPGRAKNPEMYVIPPGATADVTVTSAFRYRT